MKSPCYEKQSLPFAMVTLLVIIFGGVVLFAQSVDELIAKNIAARGGTQIWSQIRDIKIEGRYESFSRPGEFTIWRQRPDLYRFDYHQNTRPTTTGYDGRNSWWINPFYEVNRADRISTVDSVITLREKEFDSILWNYREKGHNIELAGTEDVDGSECYRLEVSLADGSNESWFIDSKSFLEVKTIGTGYDFSVKAVLETYFSDYREVGGAVFPFLIEQEYADRYRRFDVESIELNTGVDAALFDMKTEQEKYDKQAEAEK